MKRKDSCIIFRAKKGLDNKYNRPIDDGDDKYGPYPCHVGRINGTLTQKSPQISVGHSLRLYTSANVNMEDGDIIEINGTNKYIAQNVYRPLNKHAECDLMITKEV